MNDNAADDLPSRDRVSKHLLIVLDAGFAQSRVDDLVALANDRLQPSVWEVADDDFKASEEASDLLGQRTAIELGNLCRHRSRPVYFQKQRRHLLSDLFEAIRRDKCRGAWNRAALQ